MKAKVHFFITLNISIKHKASVDSLHPTQQKLPSHGLISLLHLSAPDANITAAQQTLSSGAQCQQHFHLHNFHPSFNVNTRKASKIERGSTNKGAKTTQENNNSARQQCLTLFRNGTDINQQ